MAMGYEVALIRWAGASGSDRVANGIANTPHVPMATGQTKTVGSLPVVDSEVVRGAALSPGEALSPEPSVLKEKGAASRHDLGGARR